MGVVDLTRVAHELRRRAGETEPAFSTRAIVEACFPGALVTGRNLPSGILEAVSRTKSGPVILYSRDAPTSVQRYAISHAVAHLLFDGQEAFRQPGQCRNAAVERRADAFADELLVPLDHLARYVRRWPSRCPAKHEVYLDMVDEIASRFGAPSGVIDRRIRKLRSLVRKHVRISLA